ncbi:MAG: hypothetical protein BMS9Abin11_0051 [Gammaproteobacteria bacterium]|nr:MAG: hypothetical protein BMS9Abin11_0051 [Gammaproteobacteria bacterium]
MRIKHLLYFIFALSGFSGLIYESIWSHYLKLFLGHAAYAQTLVLAIFMGGMSLGSWLSSKYSSRWKNLLLAYAIVELIIGLFGVSFHKLFVLQTDFAYLTVLPGLGSTSLSVGFKWLLAVLFILPQSILLGMTFPLMSAGVLRRYPDKPGSSISMLYFSNSIGGVAGVLSSGFVLIYLVGLPGTIMTAGIINIFLALMVWLLVRSIPMTPVTPGVLQAEVRHTPKRNKFYWAMLLVAFVTGLASFIYEIGWIRMLGLVLGSSTHAFELMLSAFILGLALGGLWIKKRIDYIKNPVWFLAMVQLVMGGLAMSTLFLYGSSFKIMQYFMGVLTRTEEGYVFFNIASHGIALFIMLPTTFLAGMTLPLITHILLKEKHGEKSIGAVYAANTVGAILGIAIAIHIGLPLLGLKGLITLGAGFDIVIGVWMIWFLAKKVTNKLRWISISSGFAVVLSTIFFIELDVQAMASGVYRTGKLMDGSNGKVVFHRDGKTATVSLIQYNNGILSIATNGKPDASINMGDGNFRSSDETTMVLAGVLPYLYYPDAKVIANIGFGSGQTTHMLLQAPWVKRVDTIEIEPVMIEASKNFRHKVVSAYTDRRSKFHIDDAKIFFSTRKNKYDIIVSEPSNPWVSGVSSLYTDEFYRLIKRHVRPDGLFVQWVQSYESENYLVASIMKAIDRNFDDYVIYSSDNGNMIILARPVGKIGPIQKRILETAAVKHELKLIDIHGLQDITLRKLGDKEILNPLFQSFPVGYNSDYYPVLDLYSTRARYMRKDAKDILDLRMSQIPTLFMLGKEKPDITESLNIHSSKYFEAAKRAYRAMAIRNYFLKGSFGAYHSKAPIDLRRNVELVRYLIASCRLNSKQDLYMDSIFKIAIATHPYLTVKDSALLWKRLNPKRCNGLTNLQKDWFSLLGTVGRRDARNMSVIARRMLTSNKIKSINQSRYLLEISMLGLMVQGEYAEANKLWQQYSRKLYGAGRIELMTRLLVAHSKKKKTLH